jgi:arylsulfatase A-like enzyme
LPDRPNILYVFTDQQSASAMRCAGNPYLRTPTMDRLAAEGTRFRNAYCAFPLCGPSRAAMMTGCMPCEIDAQTNSAKMPPDRLPESLGILMRDAGYDCGYAGKWHYHSMTIPDGEFGFRQVHPFGDVGLAESCVGFLKEQRDRPFFLVASFDNPHNICEWARNQKLPWATVDAVPTEQCPPLPANFAEGAYLPQALLHEKAGNAAVHPTAGVGPDWWRHFRHAYFRLVEHVDTQFGQIITALDDLNLANDTLVIFSSDHGDGQGAHGWNQKTALWEECVNVPFIMRLPGKVHAGVVSDALTCNGIDLLPTICDYAGVPVPGRLSGKSLRPVAEGRQTAWRDEVLVETGFVVNPGGGMWGYGGTAGRMIRTQRHKYAWYHWGQFREQLFDLEADPGEMVNLATCAAHDDDLHDHRQRLLAAAKHFGDPIVARHGFPTSVRPA